MTQPPYVAPSSLSQDDRLELRRAIYAAGQLYPGPVGEVLGIELDRWHEFGYRFGSHALVQRLVRFLLDEYDRQQREAS